MIKKWIFPAIVFFFFFINTKNAQAQEINTNLYISPTVTIGYTWGAGFNYGFDVTFGLFKILNREPGLNAALSIQYYFVNFEKSHHVIKTVCITAENDFFRIGLGGGNVKKSWGFQRINSSKAFGSVIDAGISFRNYKAPWIGFKAFVPLPDTWEWYDRPYYTSFYTYFRQEPIYPYIQQQ